jgi:hypothetical protein
MNLRLSRGGSRVLRRRARVADGLEVIQPSGLWHALRQSFDLDGDAVEMPVHTEVGMPESRASLDTSRPVGLG